MILHSDWEPTPPRPGSADEWQAALDGALEIVRHMRCGVEDCGEIRCDSCSERMTCTGPEPRACGTTCADCPCECTGCLDKRQDLRDDLLRQLSKEG